MVLFLSLWVGVPWAACFALMKWAEPVTIKKEVVDDAIRYVKSVK